MKRIVVIGSAALRVTLERRGYSVVCATAPELVETDRFEATDLVVIDATTGSFESAEVLSVFRERRRSARPRVLVLAASVAQAKGTSGIDDYLVEPVFVRELVARIEVHLRHRAPGATSLTAGDLRLESREVRAYHRDRELVLTRTEFRLLEFFMRRPGVVHSREQLLDALWMSRRFINYKIVDVYVSRLRKKIGGHANAPKYIVCSRGIGYRFVPAAAPGDSRGGMEAQVQREGPAGASGVVG